MSKQQVVKAVITIEADEGLTAADLMTQLRAAAVRMRSRNWVVARLQMAIAALPEAETAESYILRSKGGMS